MDDMPFLVDSLTMELSRQLREVHVVVHPHFDVERDITGELQSVHVIDDGALDPHEGTVRESWMHVEIGRVSEGEDLEAVVDQIHQVLRDVREATEDWARTRSRMLEIVEELGRPGPRGSTPRRCVRRASC